MAKRVVNIGKGASATPRALIMLVIRGLGNAGTKNESLAIEALEEALVHLNEDGTKKSKPKKKAKKPFIAKLASRR